MSPKDLDLKVTIVLSMRYPYYSNDYGMQQRHGLSQGKYRPAHFSNFLPNLTFARMNLYDSYQDSPQYLVYFEIKEMLRSEACHLFSEIPWVNFKRFWGTP